MLKKNLILFLTHFDDFLDTCLELYGTCDGFNSIREMKRELKTNSINMSMEEYHEREAEIFLEYLKLKNVDIHENLDYIEKDQEFLTNELMYLEHVSWEDLK